MDNKNVNQNRDFNKNTQQPKDSFSKKLGDKMERLGEKISRKGDEIEHSQDSKR